MILHVLCILTYIILLTVLYSQKKIMHKQVKCLSQDWRAEATKPCYLIKAKTTSWRPQLQAGISRDNE